MIDVEIGGGREFARAAAALRKAGTTVDKGQRTARRRTVEPGQRELRASAKATLPRRGGLGAWVARLTVSVQESQGSTTATVAHPDRARLGSIDAGTVRHLVYGRRPLVRQTVREGFARKVFDRMRQRLRTEAADALQESIQTVAREAS